jgi:hypothetical protein
VTHNQKQQTKSEPPVLDGNKRKEEYYRLAQGGHTADGTERGGIPAAHEKKGVDDAQAVSQLLLKVGLDKRISSSNHVAKNPDRAAHAGAGTNTCFADHFPKRTFYFILWRSVALGKRQIGLRFVHRPVE